MTGIVDWAVDSAVDQIGDERFNSVLEERWNSLQGSHGGIVAAKCVRAAESAIGAAGISGLVLRAATFGYVRGNSPGPIELVVDVVRSGKALVTTHVTTYQESKVTTSARLHFSSPWEGSEFSEAPSPPRRPRETVRLDQIALKTHLENVEAHIDPARSPFSAAPSGEWLAWCRPKHGGNFDSAWLAMFADYFPPAVFVRDTGPSRAVTIEYSLQIHDAAADWNLSAEELLAARMHVFHSYEGFAVEDGWIWRPDGRLLATSRQTRLAGGAKP